MTEQLKLDNQVCFPIYALAKEIINRYRPFMDELELTYPQYLVMMVLWEHKEQTVSQLGEKLNLDSGTLTPLLKRLEQKCLVTRKRSSLDERVVMIELTHEGKTLSKKAAKVPERMFESLNISEEEIVHLKNNINSILKTLQTK
ncbi:MAG: MarR family transcriptional regulator [Chryseobacterium sp. 39-10]|nr:MarR family transcriptional regulator [Chryseobacterium sp.]OJV49502.1 MAG: MarR family transcriptional regulator [Chryseobacterium sp. 39-10]